MMEQDMQQILFTQDQVAARVQELAAQITRDYAGKTPLVVGVLRGSFIFMADILDTGNTLSKLVAELKGRHPASLKLCVLLDKPERRTRPLEADYVGFTIPDAFVVGCGLDYDQKYRQLPYIGVLKPSVYE